MEKKTRESFGQIQQAVKKSKFHSVEWERLHNDEDDYEEQALEKTMCHNSARFILYLLVGGRQQLPKSSLGDFQGNLQEFKSCTTAVCSSLVARSEFPENLVFYLHFPQGDHTLVIEKRGSKKKTCWRVHQSYALEFTLSEWLGIEKWRSKDPGLTQEFRKYGHGKCLSQEELIEFLNIYLSDDPNFTFQVEMYSLNC